MSTPSAITTFSAPTGDPGPVRVAALARLLAELGPKETEGRNWGPFIRRMAGYFLSAARIALYGPGGEKAGDLAWCALTVCGMIYEELVARGQTELAAQWKRIASAECSTLHEHLDAHGYAWRRGAPLPAALCPQSTDACGLPGPGDLVFYGAVKPDGTFDFHHVDFYLDDPGEGFRSAGGNSGAHVDAVAIEHRTDESRVLCYARVPW